MSDDSTSAEQQPEKRAPFHKRAWRWLVDKIERRRNEKRAKREAEQPQERLARRTLVATWFIAFAGAATAFAAFLQWQTFESTDRVLHAQQRAIVYLGAVGYRLDTRSLEPPCCIWNLPSAQQTEQVVQFSFAFGNSGNSDTKRLVVSTQCVRKGPPAQPEEPFSLFKWDDNEARPLTIAPKQTVIVRGGAGCTLTQDEVFDFRMGIVHLYVVGEARYGDRFDEGRPFVTQFAFEMSVLAGEDDLSKFSASGLAVGRHNCTDDDCESQ